MQDAVPFSSARKWSAARIADRWWVIGAPDVVDPTVDTGRWSATGARVLLLAVTDQTVEADSALPC